MTVDGWRQGWLLPAGGPRPCGWTSGRAVGTGPGCSSVPAALLALAALAAGRARRCEPPRARCAAAGRAGAGSRSSCPRCWDGARRAGGALLALVAVALPALGAPASAGPRRRSPLGGRGWLAVALRRARGGRRRGAGPARPRLSVLLVPRPGARRPAELNRSSSGRSRNVHDSPATSRLPATVSTPNRQGVAAEQWRAEQAGSRRPAPAGATGRRRSRPARSTGPAGRRASAPAACSARDQRGAHHQQRDHAVQQLLDDALAGRGGRKGARAGQRGHRQGGAPRRPAAARCRAGRRSRRRHRAGRPAGRRRSVVSAAPPAASLRRTSLRARATRCSPGSGSASVAASPVHTRFPAITAASSPSRAAGPASRPTGAGHERQQRGRRGPRCTGSRSG